jgi:hypothetical protein
MSIPHSIPSLFSRKTEELLPKAKFCKIKKATIMIIGEYANIIHDFRRKKERQPI